MNEILLSSSDIMLILTAIAVSFALGGAFRLGRTAVRERRAVDLTDHDLRTLSDRYENQQRNVSRLTRELSDVREALMQQAMAMGPVHAALRVSGVGAAMGTPAAPVQAPPAPAPVAPAAQPPPAPMPASAPAPAAAAPQVAVKSPPMQRPTERPVSAPRSPAPAAVKAAAAPASKSHKATPLELARAGAPVELLMSRCGLSRAEAELVVSVHGKSSQTAA